MKHLYLTGYTPYPLLSQGDPRLPHIAQKLAGQIHKTAIGAEKIVPFTHYEKLADATSRLRQQGYEIWALEQTPKSTDLPKVAAAFAPKSLTKIALLLGNEVNGLGQDELSEANAAVEIPMHGQKESFNVGVALGIALYAIQDAFDYQR